MQRLREGEKAACSRNCKYGKYFSVGWRWRWGRRDQSAGSRAAWMCTASYTLQSGQREQLSSRALQIAKWPTWAAFLILPLSGSLPLSGPPH